MSVQTGVLAAIGVCVIALAATHLVTAAQVRAHVVIADFKTHMGSDLLCTNKQIVHDRT